MIRLRPAVGVASSFVPPLRDYGGQGSKSKSKSKMT